MNAWVLYPGWCYEDDLAPEREAIASAFPDSHGIIIGEIPAGSVVIPRFRALPFGRELEAEVAHRGASLINTYRQHRFAADLGQWYPVFADLTPTTWHDVLTVPLSETGPFIVKGETNSRRQLWNTHCFAPERASLGLVISNLVADTLIGHQHLYIRRYVPLHSYGEDVVGMPISDEYRVFYLDGVELSRGFYWANHAEHLAGLGIVPDPSSIPAELVGEVGARLTDHIRFAAVDFARTAAGDWTVIEVNDGSMAGICGVSADCLWKALADHLS